MTQSATNIKSFIQDNYSRAQLRLVELAGRARTTIEENTEKGRERIDELANQLSVKELPVKDLVEKIRTADSNVRRELQAQLGLVSVERLTELEGAIDALQKELDALRKSSKREIATLKKKLSASAKKATAKKAPAKKATAKKAPAKKATAKTAPAKN